MQREEQNVIQEGNRQIIDVDVETLFTKFDRGHEGHLTRTQIADILTEIFSEFGLKTPVTHKDVTNFLLDYDIRHVGNLTRKDFKGIDKLRFLLIDSPLNSNLNSLRVFMPQQQPEVKQIVIPVRMLFDIFDRDHDGHLSKNQVKDVIRHLFKDFNMPYQVNDQDVQNFLLDFDINHDRQITKQDFEGVEVLTFEFHPQKWRMKVD